MRNTFRCSRCRAVKPVPSGTVGTGYAMHGTARRKVCYACCADLDRRWMERHDRMLLYMHTDEAFTEAERLHQLGLRTEPDPTSTYWIILTNWCGSLRIKPHSSGVGSHNWGLRRTSVWFRDHLGSEWHGYHIGRHTQIVHCRKLKGRTQ